MTTTLDSASEGLLPGAEREESGGVDVGSPDAPPPPYEESPANVLRWRLLHVDFRPSCRNRGGILVKPTFDRFE